MLRAITGEDFLSSSSSSLSGRTCLPAHLVLYRVIRNGDDSDQFVKGPILFAPTISRIGCSHQLRSDCFQDKTARQRHHRRVFEELAAVPPRGGRFAGFCSRASLPPASFIRQMNSVPASVAAEFIIKRARVEEIQGWRAKRVTGKGNARSTRYLEWSSRVLDEIEDRRMDFEGEENGALSWRTRKISVDKQVSKR